VPYEIRRKDGAYEVVNAATGAVHARHTSREKAEWQIRLLRGVERGWKPSGKPARR